MKHFIVNGFIPAAHPPLRFESEAGPTYAHVSFVRCAGETRTQRAERYQESGMNVPTLGETAFLDFEPIGTISVFVLGVYEAFFLIKAIDQRKAYLLANALRSFLVVACSFSVPEDRDNYYLLELESAPDPTMTISDLIALVRPFPESQPLDKDWLKQELTSGQIIPHNQIREVCGMIAVGLEYPSLLETVKHLEYSYSLVWYSMTESYPVGDYYAERTESSEYESEKLYLEHSVRFDLAFLSAFRGIEALMGTPFLRRHEVAANVTALDKTLQTSFQTTDYRSYHLVFSGEPEIWTYENIINHFLVLRNSVAAHANTMSPNIIMEDQVREIQRLVESMLSDILTVVNGPLVLPAP